MREQDQTGVIGPDADQPDPGPQQGERHGDQHRTDQAQQRVRRASVHVRSGVGVVAGEPVGTVVATFSATCAGGTSKSPMNR